MTGARFVALPAGEGLVGCVSGLRVIFFKAGCATCLFLKPLRSPDRNDNPFENQSMCVRR